MPYGCLRFGSSCLDMFTFWWYLRARLFALRTDRLSNADCMEVLKTGIFILGAVHGFARSARTTGYGFVCLSVWTSFFQRAFRTVPVRSC